MTVKHLCLLVFSALPVAAFLACTSDSPLTGSHGDTIPANAYLEISGARTAQVGQSVSLSAMIRDSSGPLYSYPTTWSSSDSTLIAVSAAGTVTARRIGTVIITATAASRQDTIVFTSSLAPYTFSFADTTPPSEQRLILDAVQDAHAFQITTFGRAITDSTTISGVYAAAGCSNGGAAAFASGRTISFCLGNQGWKVMGPVMKQKIVQHELFHVWQTAYWNANPAASAIWILEGSAELMGFRGIAAKGLLSIETGLGCQVKESSDFAVNMPPGLPALSTVETKQAFQSTVGPLYTHSMLAMDNLTAGAGGLTALRVYGDSLHAGVAWQAAFTAAFGKTPAAFYSQFPAYLSGLTVPATYSCRI